MPDLNRRKQLPWKFVAANIWCCMCRYAYSEEMGDDFDEEGVSLTSSVDIAMLERKGLTEDLEEDKRE